MTVRGGRLVIAYRPVGNEGEESFPESVYRFDAPAAVEALARAAGFAAARTTTACQGRLALTVAERS